MTNVHRLCNLQLLKFLLFVVCIVFTLIRDVNFKKKRVVTMHDANFFLFDHFISVFVFRSLI